MDSKKIKKSPPADAVDLYDENWLVHEINYWEAAYDRITATYLETKKALEGWKIAHENAARSVHQWEEWYKSLEQDRDLFKQWDEEKKKEIERLQSFIQELRSVQEALQGENVQNTSQLQERIAIKKQTLERYKQDNEKIVAQVKQWEIWYADLQQDRDRYRQWDQDKRVELERVNQEVKRLQDWLETLYKNPFTYFSQFFKALFRSGKEPR